MNTGQDLRFGLVGTGYWASERHAPGIAAAEGAELVAVWGRNPVAASALAERHDAVAYDDFDSFVQQVDVVQFSVPPDVQAPMAARAAAAGKHLLLEKPIALDEANGDAIVDAVQSSGVAALVFFTHMFSPPVLSWLDTVSSDPWLGGSACWLGSSLSDANPFNTPWRRVHGGLWDVGPHAVCDLWQALGPVVDVTADRGAGDLTYLVLHHANGATSTCTLTIRAPEAADGFTLMLWGSAGRAHLPIDDVDSGVAVTMAVEELVALVISGRREHRADLQRGRDVLHVLAAAQRQLEVMSAS